MEKRLIELGQDTYKNEKDDKVKIKDLDVYCADRKEVVKKLKYKDICNNPNCPGCRTIELYYNKEKDKDGGGN